MAFCVFDWDVSCVSQDSCAASAHLCSDQFDSRWTRKTAFFEDWNDIAQKLLLQKRDEFNKGLEKQKRVDGVCSSHSSDSDRKQWSCVTASKLCVHSSVMRGDHGLMSVIVEPSFAASHLCTSLMSAKPPFPQDISRRFFQFIGRFGRPKCHSVFDQNSTVLLECCAQTVVFLSSLPLDIHW